MRHFWIKWSVLTLMGITAVCTIFLKRPTEGSMSSASIQNSSIIDECRLFPSQLHAVALSLKNTVITIEPLTNDTNRQQMYHGLAYTSVTLWMFDFSVTLPWLWGVPGLMIESSSLKVTLEFLRFLLGLWISRLPSSMVRREMRLLWAVLNSVRFWQGIDKRKIC